MLDALRKLPSLVKWLLVCVVVAALAFVGGRFTAGKVTTDTTTSTSTSTTSSTSASTSSSTSNSSSTASSQVQVVYQNQATIKQDRDTDCTENFDPATGRLVKRRCITRSSTSSTSGSSGSSTGSSTSSSTGSSTGTSASTGTSTNTTTGTTTHTTTTTTGGAGGSWAGLRLTGFASLNLLSNSKLALTPNYGIGLSKDLLGPVSVGAGIYTDKTVTASLSLGLGKNWRVSGGVASRLDSILSVSYGGSVDYRLFGPVYIGIWGYSNKSAGLSASITIP